MLRIKRPNGRSHRPGRLSRGYTARAGPSQGARITVDPGRHIGYDAPMGRDAGTTATVDGRTCNVRALLEADAVILRGDLRLRLPRDLLTGWQVAGGDLHLSAAQGDVTLHLGPNEAAAWARALDRPAPTLAQKLGFGPATRVWPVRPVTDAALLDAMRGVTVSPTADGATLGLAVVMTADDLEALTAVMADHPALPVWVVNTKGAKAIPGDTAIRTTLRAAGMIDSKTCAVSPALSATRYARRKA
jgi:hypothetical protein